MIIIPRKKDESIVLGDDIILTVIEIRGDKVRLGVEHPKGVTVHRRRCTRRSAEWSRESPRKDDRQQIVGGQSVLPG